MKKTYKLIAILFAFLTFSSFLMAQTWDAPSYKGEVPVSGTSYYIFNIGSNGFLNRGGWWGTQAVVTSHVRANASANINKWTSVNTTGSTWTFQYNNNGSDIAGNFLFDTGAGTDVYTDNTTNNTFTVTETDAVNHIFTIQSPLAGVNFVGTELATETTNKGIANIVRPNRGTANDYTNWKFVSQAYFELYQAKMLLHRYMTYAKLKGGIDLTTYIATYNSDVTVDISTAAGNLLTALGRTQITVPNFSFETAYNSSTDWTNSGFSRQSNTPGNGWIKDGTYYSEKWVSSNSNLTPSSISQTITGLSNGIYGLEATGHAVQQGGSNPLNTGAFFKAGTATAEVSAGMEYFADYAIVNNGTISIGYALEGTISCNWTGFDNFKLYYYGPTAVPSMSVSISSIYFTNALSATTTFDVSAANLTGDISLTAPTGITLSGVNVINNGGGNYTIANANANGENTVTVDWDESANLTGTISVSSTGVTTQNISISTSKDKDCYTPMYSGKTNIVTDPYISSLSNFGGWGTKNLVTDPSLVYCGASSASVGNGTSNNSGSLDFVLTGIIQPEKTYRVKAMVKTVDGTFQIGVFGWSSGQGDINNVIDTNGNWQELIFNFTTGATLGATQGMFWNNWGLTGTLGYIDNWEMYDVTDIVSGVNNTKTNEMKVFVQNNTIIADINAQAAGNAEITVYNLQGSRLYTENMNCISGFNRLVVEKQLSSGVYMVQLNVNGEITTSKIVK